MWWLHYWVCWGHTRSLRNTPEAIGEGFWRQKGGRSGCWVSARLVCVVLVWRRCGASLSWAPDSQCRGPAQACWFYLLTLNTLPLILPRFCFRLCGIGALEADTLQFTHIYRGPVVFGQQPCWCRYIFTAKLFELIPVAFFHDVCSPCCQPYEDKEIIILGYTELLTSIQIQPVACFEYLWAAISLPLLNLMMLQLPYFETCTVSQTSFHLVTLFESINALSC